MAICKANLLNSVASQGIDASSPVFANENSDSGCLGIERVERAGDGQSFPVMTSPSPSSSSPEGGGRGRVEVEGAWRGGVVVRCRASTETEAAAAADAAPRRSWKPPACPAKLGSIT